MGNVVIVNFDHHQHSTLLLLIFEHVFACQVSVFYSLTICINKCSK